MIRYSKIPGRTRMKGCLEVKEYYIFTNDIMRAHTALKVIRSHEKEGIPGHGYVLKGSRRFYYCLRRFIESDQIYAIVKGEQQLDKRVIVHNSVK